MKTITRFGFLALLLSLPPGGMAAPQAAVSSNEESCAGTLTAIHTQDHTITVRRMLMDKTFHLGQHCAVSALDKKDAVVSDLRPGEKVEIRYQNVEGILVADQIAEKALRYDGAVQAVDQKAGTVTMQEAPLYVPFHAPQMFRLAAGCEIVLPDRHDGTLAALQPGDRISVIYELPGGAPVAYRIRDRSLTLVGVVAAVDPSNHTLKAREKSSEIKFELADDCQIILNGEKPGHLKDLVLGQPCKFTYENVNGVEVLDRIVPANAAKPTQTASASRQ